jgi:hypothetical protein
MSADHYAGTSLKARGDDTRQFSPIPLCYLLETYNGYNCICFRGNTGDDLLEIELRSPSSSDTEEQQSDLTYGIKFFTETLHKHYVSDMRLSLDDAHW